MKKAIAADRRKAQRLDIPIPVRFRLSLNKKVLSELIKTDNISGTGIGMTLKRPVKEGSRLNMLLYFPDDKKPIRSTSEVVWCKRIPMKGADSYKVGAHHVKIDAKDRNRFVFLFCETMLNFLMVSYKDGFFKNVR